MFSEFPLNTSEIDEKLDVYKDAQKSWRNFQIFVIAQIKSIINCPIMLNILENNEEREFFKLIEDKKYINEKINDHNKLN